MIKYLIDTSALYPLILELGEKILLYAKEVAILDLTIYEVGNALWKEYKLGKIKNLDIVLQFFQEILNAFKKETINNISEVLKISIEKNITFYDAAYIYVVEKLKLTLITEDKEMLSKYTKAINTKEYIKGLSY